MQEIELRHKTTYSYSDFIMLQEQEIILSPKSEGCIRIVSSDLELDPPCNIKISNDRYGNVIEKAVYPSEGEKRVFTRKHSVISSFKAVYTPPCFETIRSQCLTDNLPCLPIVLESKKTRFSDYSAGLAEWMSANIDTDESYASDFDKFCSVSEKIYQSFKYNTRDQKGVQTPETTLRLGSGSCRDYTVFLMECARIMGYGARMASGYSFVRNDQTLTNQSTHVWAQIYLHDAGWVDFDPTNRSYGGECVITCSTVLDYNESVPISGCFLSYQGTKENLDVDVSLSIKTIEGPNLSFMNNNLVTVSDNHYTEKAFAMA